jgi:DNA-binding NarL/FixJ family response regulator
VIERLTPRQREVLDLMAEGLSNAAIGRRLGLPEKTIVRHTSNIYAALGLVPSADDHRRVCAVLRRFDLAPARRQAGAA